MFRSLQSRRYDTPTRLVFVLGGIVGIIVSYIFSVKGFGTQVPDMLWAARGIVVFFIALQIYVNRNKSEEQKNWALIVGGFASYIYGIYTNIVGILAFGGMTIDQITLHNLYYLIIPVMVGFPLEIAPEALLMMGFFPDNDTVMSDALSGMGGMLSAIFGGGGRKRLSTSYTPQYRPVERPTVDQMGERSTRPAPFNPPVSPLSSNRSPLNNLPRTPGNNYHSLGSFGANNTNNEEED
jgi:hypothetical protein